MYSICLCMADKSLFILYSGPIDLSSHCQASNKSEIHKQCRTVIQSLTVPWCRTEGGKKWKKCNHIHGTSVWWIPSAGHVCSPYAASASAAAACMSVCVAYACVQTCDICTSVKVSDELRFCVIYQPFLEVWNQWCVTKTSKLAFTCTLTCIWIPDTTPAHVALFCALLGSMKVIVWTQFNIFPLKYFHGWTTYRHTNFHTCNKSMSFQNVGRCYARLKTPCAINPE